MPGDAFPSGRSEPVSSGRPEIRQAQLSRVEEYAHLIVPKTGTVVIAASIPGEQMMLTLRLLLIVDALALVAASTISDPIVGDVAIAPTLFVGVLLALACLTADLVPPPRRVA